VRNNIRERNRNNQARRQRETKKEEQKHNRRERTDLQDKTEFDDGVTAVLGNIGRQSNDKQRRKQFGTGHNKSMNRGSGRIGRSFLKRRASNGQTIWQIGWRIGNECFFHDR
jgi:hypothetical protein